MIILSLKLILFSFCFDSVQDIVVVSQVPDSKKINKLYQTVMGFVSETTLSAKALFLLT